MKEAFFLICSCSTVCSGHVVVSSVIYWCFSAKLLQLSQSVFSMLMLSYFADILLWANYCILNCNRVCMYLQVVTVLPLCAL